MRLLICTQIVDTEDPILGFFHGWLLEFAKRFESVHVICLKEGKHDLPAHVHIHSLGKEYGVSYIRYITRLMSYVWTLRNEHDVVFSHMNPHYIVLAGWFWRLKKKKIFFWRNHAKMNVLTRIAASFARRVFYTSPYACTRIFSHAVQMPVGIDMSVFQPQADVNRRDHTVLLLGRLSPVKRPEIFMEASTLVPQYSFHSYGSVQEGAHAYHAMLEEKSQGHVTFHSAVPNYETPKIYSAYDIYVNLTPEGSMDKTVLEASACGALVLVANTSFKGLVPEECLISGQSPEALASHIRVLTELPRETKEAYRVQLQRMVAEKHSLTQLVTELHNQFSL